ncbi:MAG TPA: hypothetical protein VHK05_05625 [Candidatus Limnocylindrales bacterium]|nr:hypothetical protein [Candidatus Limnocylindrales bacterium]
MPDWRDRLRAVLAGIGGRRRSADTFSDLRSMALGLDPSSIRTPADEPWSGAAVAAMELSVGGATATIVAIADGTVSMYLSSGGGAIGAGEHAAVRAEGQRFRTVVADSRGLLVRTAAYPLPRTGEVRFHARIGEDRFTGVAPEAALRGGRHVLAPLYAAGQDLLTEIRLASEPREC